MLVNKKYIGIGMLSTVVAATILIPLIILKNGNTEGIDVTQTSKTGNTPTKTNNGDREAERNNNGDPETERNNNGDPETERNNNGDPEADRTRRAKEAKRIIRDKEAHKTNNGNSGGERTNNGNPESPNTVASQCADSSECTGDKLCVRDDSNSPTSCIAASSLSNCDDQEVLCPQTPKSPFDTSCQKTNDIYDVAHVSHPQCLCLGSDSTKIEDNGSGSIRTCETRCFSKDYCPPHYLCKKDPITKDPYCLAEGIATVCNSDIICGQTTTCHDSSNPMQCVCPENQATHTVASSRGSSTTCFHTCANTSDCEAERTLCHRGGEYDNLGHICKLSRQMDDDCTGVECYKNMVCYMPSFKCRCLPGEKIDVEIERKNGNEFGTCHASCAVNSCVKGTCRDDEYCARPVKRIPDPS